MMVCSQCKGNGKIVLNNAITAPNAASFSDKFGAQFGAVSRGEDQCPSCLGTGKMNAFGAS